MTLPQEQIQYYPAQQLPAQPPAQASNALAITALVVGIVAFVSGVAPFWGILAGVAAIVLGALALRKRQHKAMSIIGIVGGALAAITSLITTIMLIAGLAAAGSAIDEATGTNVVNEQSSDADPAADAPVAGSQGTRDNPLPAGSTIESQDWAVTIGATNTDVTALVLDANMFNDEPAPGNVFIQVPVSATYNGAGSGTILEVSVAYVTGDGTVVNSFDTFIAVDDACTAGTELYAGASASCNTYLEVPAAVDGTIRVKPGFLAEDAFFALS